MDESLQALLLADGAIAAHVAGRIYWGAAAQGCAAPYIVLRQISARDHAHMQGAGGLFTYRVQADCYGRDRPSARALAITLQRQINGTQAGQLRLIRFDAEREGYSPTAGGESFVLSQDYIITWRPDYG